MTESGERVYRGLPETVVSIGGRSGHPPVQAEPAPYLAGAVIGDRYRLERELGRGGMGVVLSLIHI